MQFYCYFYYFFFYHEWWGALCPVKFGITKSPIDKTIFSLIHIQVLFVSLLYILHFCCSLPILVKRSLHKTCNIYLWCKLEEFFPALMKEKWISFILQPRQEKEVPQSIIGNERAVSSNNLIQ